MKHLLSFLILFFLALTSGAQEQPSPDAPEAAEAKERVQYVLLLPEEKNPELVKPEENSPFEAHSDEAKQEGDTEENRVRDILVRLPAVGGGSGPDGMRVMLGSMRLEAGQMVPKVLPDQQVMLKVKAVSTTSIELVWVEKKPTGLPPKPFFIPVDVSPRVRYRMPSGSKEDGPGSIGTVSRDGFSAFSPRPSTSDEPPSAQVAVKALPVEEKSDTATTPAPVSANVPEASVLRMLFGNHAPKAK